MSLAQRPRHRLPRDRRVRTVPAARPASHSEGAGAGAPTDVGGPRRRRRRRKTGYQDRAAVLQHPAQRSPTPGRSRIGLSASDAPIESSPERSYRDARQNQHEASRADAGNDRRHRPHHPQASANASNHERDQRQEERQSDERKTVPRSSHGRCRHVLAGSTRSGSPYNSCFGSVRNGRQYRL